MCDHPFFYINGMSIRTIIVIGILATMLQGCCGYKAPEFVKLDNVDVKEVSMKYVTAEVEATIYNPGRHDISIESAELDVLFANKNAGLLSLRDQNTIKAKDQARCNFVVKISTKEALKAGMTSIDEFDKNKSIIRLKGKVTGKYWFFKKKLNVDTTFKP